MHWQQFLGPPKPRHFPVSIPCPFAGNGLGLSSLCSGTPLVSAVYSTLTRTHTTRTHALGPKPPLVYAFALTSSLTQANGNLEGEFGDRWAASGEKYLQRALLAEEKLVCALDRERALQQQVIEVATGVQKQKEEHGCTTVT